MPEIEEFQTLNSFSVEAGFWPFLIVCLEWQALKKAKIWPLHPGKIINFSVFKAENSKKHESRYFCRFFAVFGQIFHFLKN